MKIYIAAPWVHKSDASQTGKILRSHGYVVVSRWHDNQYKEDKQKDQILLEEATKDLEDVRSADALVYLNLCKSEGKATELGVSIQREIPIHVVGGKDNNVFLNLPQIHHHESLETVLRSLDHASRSQETVR